MEVALSNNGSDETRYHYLKGAFPEQRPQRYKKVLHWKSVLKWPPEKSVSLALTSEEGSLGITAVGDSRSLAATRDSWMYKTNSDCDMVIVEVYNWSAINSRYIPDIRELISSAIYPNTLQYYCFISERDKNKGNYNFVLCVRISVKRGLLFWMKENALKRFLRVFLPKGKEVTINFVCIILEFGITILRMYF
jgi:hypothetical protein